MKKAFTLLGLLILNLAGISYNSYSQYVPALRDNSEWYTNSWFEISYNTTFQIFGDSTVNGIAYKKLINFPTGEPGPYDALDFIREDTILKSIYRIANGIEYKLYDFSLQVGDTFSVNNSEWGSDPINLVLDSITDTIYNNTGNFLEVNIDNKKVFYFHNAYYTWYDNIVWIEGVGSLAGIINSAIDWSGGSNGETLLCHYNENGFRDFHYIYYEEPNPCEAFVGIKSFNNLNDVKIFPNPSFDGLIKVEGQNIKSIEILNSLGSFISYSNITSNESKLINLEKMPKGVYFIRIIFNGGDYAISKLIKM